jgi:hypothetical protein
VAQVLRLPGLFCYVCFEQLSKPRRRPPQTVQSVAIGFGRVLREKIRNHGDRAEAVLHRMHALRARRKLSDIHQLRDGHHGALFVHNTCPNLRMENARGYGTRTHAPARFWSSRSIIVEPQDRNSCRRRRRNPHSQAHTIPISPRSDEELPRSIVNTGHGIRSIAEDVQDYLLELDAIAGERG